MRERREGCSWPDVQVAIWVDALKNPLSALLILSHNFSREQGATGGGRACKEYLNKNTSASEADEVKSPICCGACKATCRGLKILSRNFHKISVTSLGKFN
eukprot:1143672-Pelagomonas_calceolata.AAC.3